MCAGDRNDFFNVRHLSGLLMYLVAVGAILTFGSLRCVSESVPIPLKSINKLVAYADLVISHVKCGNVEGTPSILLTSLNKEWFPKFALLMLNRGYLLTFFRVV
jgi:hypothetical protein